MPTPKPDAKNPYHQSEWTTPASVDLQGATAAFRKFSSTMITEPLYAIPESAFDELGRYSKTSHVSFAVSGSAAAIAIATGIQLYTTSDSDPVRTWVVIAVSITVCILTAIYGGLSIYNRRSYLKQLKNSSSPVSAEAAMTSASRQQDPDTPTDSHPQGEE